MVTDDFVKIMGPFYTHIHNNWTAI